nr:zinc finger, CCHC-type [Tanacetum cinerariifolium]
MNAGEFPKMDPYEEVAQQGQVHPLSPAYVPDPMELDEHVHVHVPEPEYPEYHAPSDDDIQVEDDHENPEEDPSEEHEPENDDEDPEEDPNEEHEPEDEDTREPSEDSDETEPFEEDETVVTPPPPRHHGARMSVRTQTPMAASTQVLIDAFAAVSSPYPLPPTSPAYDQAPLESSAATARAPRSQYDFVDTVKAGQGLIRSFGHDAQTIARAADRAEDVGYVRALQASERRMMTSIEEVKLRVSYQAQVHRQESKYFYTQLHDAQTDRKDIRLEIDVVRGGLRDRATRAPEREGSCSHSDDAIMPVTRQGTNDAMTPESIQAMIDWAIQRNSTHTQDDASQSSGRGLKRPVQPTRACSYTDFMKCQPLNFKGTKDVVGLSQWLEKMESVFHISSCAVDNQVKFATCTLLGAALTWWNGYVRTLGYEVAYAMTWGTLKKKITGKYYPKGEIKKLETELWNLRVKRSLEFAKLEKFEGVDFRRWKKKIHFLLFRKSVVYMLTTLIPKDRGDNPTVEQVRRRVKWDNDDYVYRGLILNELGSHQRIEESFRVHDSDKPKENNVAGPSVVNMVEHNNSSRKPDHLKRDCKGGNVGNKSNGSGTKVSGDGSSNPMKGQNMFNKSLQIYYVTYVSKAYFVQVNDVAWWVDSKATVHDVFIGFGYLSNQMFRLNIVTKNIGSAFMSTSKLNDSIPWHARLGHVYYKGMQDMCKDGLIIAFNIDTQKCKTCIVTKITKKSFQNVKRGTKVLELIHSDLCDLHAALH